MTLLLSAIPVLVVLIVFLTVLRKSGRTRDRYRPPSRQPRPVRAPGQEIDPNFQFDAPPAEDRERS
jgi:hypothetical protein